MTYEQLMYPVIGFGNQWTGFYMRETLVDNNGLNIECFLETPSAFNVYRKSRSALMVNLTLSKLHFLQIGWEKSRV